MRGKSNGRREKPSGHPPVKITDEMACEIWKAYHVERAVLHDLAEKYNVSHKTIRAIADGELRAKATQQLALQRL